jgi:hypothetical protein
MRNYTNEPTELTLEDLADRWEMLRWKYGVEKLKVIESFTVSGINRFIVSGLSMELEGDCVMCNDYNGVIVTYISHLLMFLKESLTRILLLPLGNGLYQERLEFGNNGIILIEIA